MVTEGYFKTKDKVNCGGDLSAISSMMNKRGSFIALQKDKLL